MASTHDNAHDDGRQSDLAVMEANEYKQKHRLKRILEVMDNIEAQSNEAYDQYVAGEITHDAKNIIIQRAVKQAIRECYNLLRDHHRERLDTNDDGEITDWSEYWIGKPNDPIGTIELPNGEDETITGLRDFLHTEEFYIERWNETESVRNKQTKNVEQTYETSVPEDVSWRAALVLKEFLNAQHDLEIRFEELDDSLPSWGFKEVDEDND